MPLNNKELEELLNLMSKHNVRQLTMGDMTITKDPATPTFQKSKKRPTPKDPTDELLDLISNREEDE